ncbi:YopX family protein [Vibrio quintilis]|uniref:YopX protein n=1 Tax=Vibrio quintilis TaxID=1117707 RepID=A0A1M7YYV6_9VIBR|nr:YopX family protein [Vibrio quintilis]SHO57877.1 YopX protein [Vibrio quintilis]
MKFQILWLRHNADFSTEITSHHTTLDRLTSGEDRFPYSEVEVIAKRQFTGISDDVGVEIYEGDVIAATECDDSEEYTTVVQRDGTALCIDVEGREYDMTDIVWARRHGEVCNMRVIGNVYENPELNEMKF